MSILDSYKDQLARLKTACDLAFGEGMTANSGSPEDQAVIFPLGVIARNLYEEVVCLVDQGLGFAALRTSRTLYECVIICLYMDKRPETCKNYLATWSANWAQVIRNVPQAEQNLPDIHKTLTEQVPAYANGKKHISLSWNDDGTTQKMAMDIGISSHFHSLAFNYASAFVHPSPLFFTRNFVKLPGTSQFVPGKTTQDQEAKFALKITHDLIIDAIRLRLKYSDNIALRESLANCEQDFLNIWGYKPQLTAAS
jgi:hypothetical protein